MALSSEHCASPVIARIDPGRPALLRNLWLIDVDLKDSGETVAHVVNRTTTLCHISEPIAKFTPTKYLVEAVRDAIKGMLLKGGRSSLGL